MNITIVGFLDEYVEYFRGDYDGGHDAASRIDYPDTEEAASAIVAELLIENDLPKHGDWDITILFDGRPPTEDQEEIEERIRKPAEAAFEKARAKRLEDERKERERQEAKRLADEEENKKRNEKREREELARLLQKYGDSRRQQVI